MGVLVEIVNLFLGFYWLLLLARALISWIPSIDPYHPIVRFIYNFTEPVLEPIRAALRAILPQNMPIDFSIFVAMLIIFALQRLLYTLT